MVSSKGSYQEIIIIYSVRILDYKQKCLSFYIYLSKNKMLKVQGHLMLENYIRFSCIVYYIVVVIIIIIVVSISLSEIIIKHVFIDDGDWSYMKEEKSIMYWLTSLMHIHNPTVPYNTA